MKRVIMIAVVAGLAIMALLIALPFSVAGTDEPATVFEATIERIPTNPATGAGEISIRADGSYMIEIQGAIPFASYEAMIFHGPFNTPVNLGSAVVNGNGDYELYGNLIPGPYSQVRLLISAPGPVPAYTNSFRVP